MRVEHIVLALVAVCALVMVGHQVWHDHEEQQQHGPRNVRMSGGVLVDADGKPVAPTAREPRANPDDAEFNTPAQPDPTGAKAVESASAPATPATTADAEPPTAVPPAAPEPTADSTEPQPEVDREPPPVAPETHAKPPEVETPPPVERREALPTARVTTGALIVRVRDAVSGAAIANCAVEVKATTASGETGVIESRFERTNPDGDFELATLAEGAYDVALVGKEWLPAEHRAVVVPGAPTDVLLMAERGASIAGEVDDPDGAPLAGATVELIAKPTSALEHAKSVKTGKDGTFVLAELRVVKDAAYSLRVHHPRFPKDAGATAELERGERCEVGKITFADERPKARPPEPRAPTVAEAPTPAAPPAPVSTEAFLRGRVRDASGNWLEHVKVTAGALSAVTGSDGSFEIRTPSDDPVDVRLHWFAPNEPSAPLERTLHGVVPDGKVRTIDLPRAGLVFVLENSGKDAVKGPLALIGKGPTQRVNLKYPTLGSLVRVPTELEPGPWEFQLTADGFETEVVKAELPQSLATSEYRVAVALRRKT